MTMTTYKTLALVFWVGCLTACNESDSNDIDTSRIILDAVLTANDDNVNMRVDLRKEGSDSIKLALNGGDYLKANADTQTKVMEYQSDIFKNSYYRASFSLNLASRYGVTLKRPEQNINYENIFPTVPTAFKLVLPLADQNFSLMAQPKLTVTWDNANINSQYLTLSQEYICNWKNATTTTERTGNTLSSNERGQRAITINMAEFINSHKPLAYSPENPHITTTQVEAQLDWCSLRLTLDAENKGQTHAELSNRSSIISHRDSEVLVKLTP